MFISSSKGRVTAFGAKTNVYNGRTLFTTNVSTGTMVTGVFDKELRVVFLELDVLWKLYATGDITTLKTVLTNEKYAALSLTLGRLRSSNFEYELIRTSSLSFLQGLQRAFFQNIELTDTKTSYAVVKQRADILDDMDRLREYLIDLNSKANTSVFGEYAVTASVAAVISPQFLIYIEKYGYPPDGVFDSDKLASVNIRAEYA
jgi:hypothetical protein